MTLQPSTEDKFGEGLLEGLREAVEWRKGRLALDMVVVIPPAPPENKDAMVE